MNRPKILLADEPTGALDTHTGQEVLNLFEELHQSDLTLIIITHDPEVGNRAQRLIRMRDGYLEDCISQIMHEKSSRRNP